MIIQPLRRVLSLQPLLAILLPFGVVVLLGVFWAVPQIRSDAGERQLLLARSVGMQVEGHLETGVAIVTASAAMPFDSRLTEHGYQQHLDALLSSTDTMSSMYAIAPDGKVFVVALKEKQELHQNDLKNLDFSRNPLFRDVSQMRKPLWSTTFLSAVNGGLAVAYGVQNGTTGTTVIGEVDLVLLTKFLKQVSTENDLLIMIIDHKGQVVADNNGRYTAQQLNISNIPLVRSGIESDTSSTGRFVFAGESMTGSIVQIPTVDWHVMVAKTDASLFRTPRNIALIVLSGILLALLCALMTSMYLARKLVSRFNDLTRYAEEIAEGGRSGDWPTSSIAEFNQLSGSLQHMAGRLQDSETLYRTLFNELPDGIVLFNIPELEPVQFNTVAHAMLGYSREEYSLLILADIEAEHDEGRITAILEKVRKDGTASFETAHRTKNGASRDMLVTLRMIELGRQQLILALHRDITHVKLSEKNLDESRMFLADMVEYSGMIIAVKDTEGRYEMVNRKWESVTGLTRQEALGKSDEELFPHSIGERFGLNDLAAIESGTCLETEEMVVTASQEQRYAISVKFPLKAGDGSVRGICVMSTDITDRKRAEENRLQLEQQLLHAQKLESLGVLAGGIAHDFNNILMAIMGNADLALMRINKESPAVDNLHKIEQSAARAADLAKQMLAYSGKGKFVVENLDMNTLLEEMLHMLEVSISKKAVLRLNPFHPLPSVEADATQMRQIVMNLVINASEAIGDRSGVIAITTGCMECDRGYLKDVWLDENISEGLYVYLEITDSGCGMDKDTLAKLFDPFFTTKFTGRGLGMAAVQGIVRGHKGAIKVYSEPGKGTSFKLLLPASDRPAKLSGCEFTGDNWQGLGTVLLVDDEETVRCIGTEMLGELGFKTITARDGNEAVDIFKNNPGISFVILDLTMPHMDGEQCFRALRNLNPDVRVIISSGYNEQEIIPKFAGKGLAGFIQKPYRLVVLKDVIRACERV
jgi:PAS domain S-box-containing protein